MRVSFESDNAINHQLQDPVLRETRRATRQLSWAVTRAKIKLSEVLSGAGPALKQVRVEYTLRHFATVIATAQAADWNLALQRALRRAARAVPTIRRRSRAGVRPMQAY